MVRFRPGVNLYEHALGTERKHSREQTRRGRPLDDREGSILDIAYFRPTDPVIRRELLAASATEELTPV